VTRKRSQRSGEADAPITGVASGYLGTGTNLDDTQVLETADLQAAAAAATADVPDEPVSRGAEAASPVAAAVVAAKANDAGNAPPPRPIEKAPVERVVRQRPAASAGAAPGERRLPVLAGIAAFVILLLVAGFGFFSQLDLGVAGPAATVPVAEAATQPPPAATPQPEQKAGKGKGGGCHGRHCGD
jgi:hypothetical protein